MECHEKYNTTILGVQEVAEEVVEKYGILAGKAVEDGIYRVEDLVEKPSKEEAPSNIAILGRYIIYPGIFDILEETKPGKGGEIQLTDALRELSRQEAIYAYVFEGRRYDVGDKLGFLEANIEFALRKGDLREDLLKFLIRILEEESSCT